MEVACVFYGHGQTAVCCEEPSCAYIYMRARRRVLFCLFVCVRPCACDNACLYVRMFVLFYKKDFLRLYFDQNIPARTHSYAQTHARRAGDDTAKASGRGHKHAYTHTLRQEILNQGITYTADTHGPR